MRCWVTTPGHHPLQQAGGGCCCGTLWPWTPMDCARLVAAHVRKRCRPVPAWFKPPTIPSIQPPDWG